MHKQKPVYRSIIYIFMYFIKVDFVAILAVDFSGVVALYDILVLKRSRTDARRRLPCKSFPTIGFSY